MSDEEVAQKGLPLAYDAAHLLHNEVKYFLDRADVQLAFHFMCHKAGWDIHDDTRMHELTRAAGLMLGIYMADKRRGLEEWPVLPADPPNSGPE